MLVNLLVTILISAFSGIAHANNDHVIRVELKGITTVKGSIRARLDANPTAFGNDAPPASTAEFSISSMDVELVFRNIAPGTYAIKVFHDENDDAKMNTNILGIPSEKYGISQNARGRFGLPSFEQASFNLTGPETVLSIELKHHEIF